MGARLSCGVYEGQNHHRSTGLQTIAPHTHSCFPAGVPCAQRPPQSAWAVTALRADEMLSGPVLLSDLQSICSPQWEPVPSERKLPEPVAPLSVYFFALGDKSPPGSSQVSSVPRRVGLSRGGWSMAPAEDEPERLSCRGAQNRRNPNSTPENNTLKIPRCYSVSELGPALCQRRSSVSK